MYENYNHNRTLLGTFETRKEAEKDAAEYRHQTGNPVEIIKTMTTVIVNINLEIPTPYKTKARAIKFAENYELPNHYQEDSFEIVKVIDSH